MPARNPRIKPERKHLLTCRNVRQPVTVFVIEDSARGGFWWSIKGSHSVIFTSGRPFRSGKQLTVVPTDDYFTYYGDGTDKRPDNVADFETLSWLLRDR